MAASKITAYLSSVAKYWLSVGQTEAGEFLNDFVALCDDYSVSDIASLRQTLSSWNLDPAMNTVGGMASIVFLTDATVSLLSSIAKPAPVKILNTFLGIVRDCSEMEPSDFLSKLRIALAGRTAGKQQSAANDEELSVEEYVSMLRESIADVEAFKVVFTRLENDRSMTKERVIEVASAFAFKMAKSTSRKLALQRIWDQHEVSTATGAKIRASSGKSAA